MVNKLKQVESIVTCKDEINKINLSTLTKDNMTHLSNDVI